MTIKTNKLESVETLKSIVETELFKSTGKKESVTMYEYKNSDDLKFAAMREDGLTAAFIHTSYDFKKGSFVKIHKIGILY